MANERRSVPDLKMESSLTKPAELSATTGIKPSGAKTSPHDTSTNAPVVANHRTVLKTAVLQRKRKPLTPLVADGWETAIHSFQLHERYFQIPKFIRNGALAGIPRIQRTFAPPNNQSTELLSHAFIDIIQSEFNKGRYLGPFSQEELEDEIGPFQSSPLSLVPKSGKPGKYRLIQNLSYPHTNTPIPSINSHLNSDDFPCTWGTFRTVCTLVRNIPPGTQAATRDIAEAYRIIPLHESQWAGVVVRTSNNPKQFALNTCNCFGGATAGGLFGLFADALADILRARGIGPILKWVDDFIFFRIPRKAILQYNNERDRNREIIAETGGKRTSGGRIWYKGRMTADAGAEHFAEDLAFPIRRDQTNREKGDTYAYGLEDIDEITEPLGIPWEVSKDTPFSSVVLFAGLEWDLEEKRVSIPEPKKEKYMRAILEWQQRVTHNLEDARRLYGKLLYTCHVIPQGRAYLTNLEKMMRTFQDRPFTPRHPPKHLTADLVWWQETLARPSLSREIPGNRQIFDVEGYSDASSTVGIGITVGNRWRAWRLLPGWKQEGRDIGWAEAIGMELLVQTILSHNSLPGLQVHGDNIGVIEGWWAGRSRNAETNRVFRRIHQLLENRDTILSTRYVNTSRNPADGPSRGIYPPKHLLLPPIDLPDEIRPFLVDFDAPTQPCEEGLPRSLPPEPKTTLSPAEQQRRRQVNTQADEQPDHTTEAPPLD